MSKNEEPKVYRVAGAICRHCNSMLHNEWGTRNCPKCGAPLKASDRIKFWDKNIPDSQPLSELELDDVAEALLEQPPVANWSSRVVSRLVATVKEDRALVEKQRTMMFNSTDEGLSKYADPRLKDDLPH